METECLAGEYSCGGVRGCTAGEGCGGAECEGVGG